MEPRRSRPTTAKCSRYYALRDRKGQRRIETGQGSHWEQRPRFRCLELVKVTAGRHGPCARTAILYPEDVSLSLCKQAHLPLEARVRVRKLVFNQ